MAHRCFIPVLQAFSILSWFQHPSAVVLSFRPPPFASTLRPHSITFTSGMLPSSNDAYLAVAAAPFSSSHNLSPSLAFFTNRKRTITNLAQQQQPTTTPEEEEEIELTPPIIAEMIEVSFLQSCLQLSQGYIDVLKLFIVATKSGYELNIPLSELHQLVKDCPVNSAGRDLMKEELELRLEWMRMVYEMLNALNDGNSLSGVDCSTIGGGGVGDEDEAAASASSKRISTVVQAMLAIQSKIQTEETSTGGKQDATVALTTLTVEQALERSVSLMEMNESLVDNPMEKAFLTNDIRVALVTFRVLEEEKICMQDSAGRSTSGGGGGGGELNGGGGEVPRPSIPGT